MEISRVLHNIHVIIVMRVQKPMWINELNYVEFIMNVWNFSKIYNILNQMLFTDSCDKTKSMMMHGFQIDHLGFTN